MAISGNCPNCGSTLPPGATACARCGHRLAEPAPEEAPSAANPLKEPAGRPAAGQTLDVMEEFNKVRERWGVADSQIFLAALGMAVLAFLISTVTGPSLVAAGDDAFGRRIDNAVWLQLAFGLAVGSAALAVYIRYEAGPPRASTDSDIDFKVVAGLAGLTLVFALLGLFKGFDGSFDGADSWFRYANVYAAIVVAGFAISRPVPRELGTTPSTRIGVGAVGVAGAMLVIGLIMGLSNDADTFATGVALQAAGTVLVIVSLGWFLGLRAER